MEGKKMEELQLALDDVDVMVERARKMLSEVFVQIVCAREVLDSLADSCEFVADCIESDTTSRSGDSSSAGCE